MKEIIDNYLEEKQNSFSNNSLANKLRHDFPKYIHDKLPDSTRYKVVGSPGKGQWTTCPWIAILDTLSTDSPQSGFYPVFLFNANMTGVYLSLNQGVTEVIENYKARASDILKRRAKDFRDKLEFTEDLISEIDLNSTNQTPIFYEYGNIVAKFYPANNLPDSDELLNDILLFLKLYDQIIYNDTTETEETQLTAIEKKQVRLHYRIERNSSISKKVKKAKGYKCEACSFEFSSKYGELGDEFVEAHHLTPIATLEIGKIELNLINDFAVLCSNCHKMIHRLKDPSDLTYFKTLIKN